MRLFKGECNSLAFFIGSASHLYTRLCVIPHLMRNPELNIKTLDTRWSLPSNFVIGGGYDKRGKPRGINPKKTINLRTTFININRKVTIGIFLYHISLY